MWKSGRCEGQRKGEVKAAGSFSHTSPALLQQPCEWLGCIFQSPQGETTNRKLAMFSFHPLCLSASAWSMLQEWGQAGSRSGRLWGRRGTFGKASRRGNRPGKRDWRRQGLDLQRPSTGGTQEPVVGAARPPYLQIPHPLIHPITDQKYLKKNSRK